MEEAKKFDQEKTSFSPEKVFLVENEEVEKLEEQKNWTLKLSCDSHFQRAFTACVSVFKVITLA